MTGYQNFAQLTSYAAAHVTFCLRTHRPPSNWTGADPNEPDAKMHQSKLDRGRKQSGRLGYLQYRWLVRLSTSHYAAPYIRSLSWNSDVREKKGNGASVRPERLHSVSLQMHPNWLWWLSKCLGRELWMSPSSFMGEMIGSEGKRAVIFTHTHSLCVMLSGKLVLPANQKQRWAASPASGWIKDFQRQSDSLWHIQSNHTPASLMAVCSRRRARASAWEEVERRKAEREREAPSPLSVLSHLNNAASPLVLPSITYGLSPMVQQQGSLIIG